MTLRLSEEQTAKLRAAQRVQRFLDAAQAIITEKGSTDFTVQEVVDRSRQHHRWWHGRRWHGHDTVGVGPASNRSGWLGR